MVGLMSREMSIFYTGPYAKALNKEHQGIMPLNIFQDQSDDPLSIVVNAKANSTVLNFKLTDLAEMSIYDTKEQSPKIKRKEVISTVHIAQTPGKYERLEDKYNPEKRKVLEDGEPAIPG